MERENERGDMERKNERERWRESETGRDGERVKEGEMERGWERGGDGDRSALRSSVACHRRVSREMTQLLS